MTQKKIHHSELKSHSIIEFLEFKNTKRLKMVKLTDENETVNELSGTSNVFLHCKNCKIEFGYRRNFDSELGFWKINIADLNWDVKVIIIMKEVYCQCGKILGETFGIHHLKFKKSSIKVIYEIRKEQQPVMDWDD